MSYNAQYDLTNQKVENTFQQIVQYNTSSDIAYDGQGNSLDSFSASYAITASYAANSSGETQTSCSWASSSISSSYSPWADFVGSASWSSASISSSYSTSGSYALSSSYASSNPPYFVSSLIAMSTGTTLYYASHSLGIIPARVRAVLVVQGVNATNNGYLVNDEIDHTSFGQFGGAQPMALTANQNAIVLSLGAPFGDGGANGYLIANKTGGASFTLASGSGKWKFYAWL